MKKEDLGKHFIKDDVVYEAIGYTDKPTMELINRETGNRLSVVIGSDYANEFELVPEDKKLNLDHTQYSLIPSWFRDEEMIKEAYILMVKNNPDEAIKNLIRLDKELAVKNNKISKAIEYIERNCLEFNEKYACQGLNNDKVDVLLDILRGKDNE